MAKTLIPNDFRDFLNIISILGFIAIFFEFTLTNPFLSTKLTPLFLLLGGSALLIAGKIIKIKDWLRDGIQPNEVIQVFALILGLTSIVMGILLFFNVELIPQIQGLVGLIALGPAIFIFLDYIAKNTK